MGAVSPAADKVHALYECRQPLETDPMMNSDERDLLRWTEQAGFDEVHLELRANVAPCRSPQWDVDIRIAGNPTIPTLEEVLREALMRAEAEQFTAYMKPRVERGEGTSRLAVAYLWAVKGSG